MLNRREFLGIVGLHVTGIETCATETAGAATEIEDHTASGFNGGRSQVNFGFIGWGGEYPFLNVVNAGGTWAYQTNPNANGQVSPKFNDSNGYPTQCQSGGYGATSVIPPTTVRPGNYVCRWVGGDRTTSMLNPGSSVVSGKTTGANGRFVFTPNASATPGSLRYGCTTISSSPSNYVRSIAIMHVDDEAAWLSGEIFGKQFKAVLRKGGFGVYRFMNWALNNIPNISTWDTRKPATYFTFADDEYRASLFAGTTTNSANDYSISFGSGGPVDKQTIQLYFNANATYVSATISFSGTATVNWTAHGYTGGEPIGFTGSGGNLPSNICNSVTYYVLTAGLTTNSFQVGTTPGGTPVAYGTGGAGSPIGTRLCTLNLNSTGAVAIKFPAGQATNASTIPSVNSPGGQAALATLVYDADLNSWLKAGGDSSGSRGIGNGCPYEVMLRLCKEMGAHPWFPAPFMSVDPMTDFHTQLAAYIRANMPTWMIPRFETCNEVWDDLNYQTQYAFGKAFVHWNKQFGSGQFASCDWQGKTCSTIGQAVNAVYGGPVGAGYQIINGQWGSQFRKSGANGFTNRLTSHNYEYQSQPAQSGYVKSAAYHWMTHVCCDSYVNPTEENSKQEETDAAIFVSNAAQIIGSIARGILTVESLTNGTLVIGQAINDQYGFIPSGVIITGGGRTSWTVSDSSISLASGTILFAMNAKARAVATSYADTCGGPADGVNNLAQHKIHVTNLYKWVQTYPNSAGERIKLAAYEGGYAPDLNGTAQIKALRNASKFVGDIGLIITGGTLANGAAVTGLYTDFASVGGEFASLFVLGGTNNIWSVLDPDIYARPQPAQFTAIASFNA
jgi:hypothetical protein